MKKIRFMDVSFRDGFQSVLGARVKMEDFLPALEAAVEAGLDNFEVAGGARFQSPFFYCQENAFDMMDACRKAVGPDVNLQSLARGANVVSLNSECREIIDLHAKMFKKHGVTTVRNFDALNDVRNLDFSGRCIKKHGLKHQVSVTMMGLPPGVHDSYAHTPKFYADTLKKIIEADIPYDSICFKDASGTSTPQTVFDTIKLARDMVSKDIDIHFHTHFSAGSAGNCLMAAIEGGADLIDLAMAPVSAGTSHMDILSMWHILRGTKYVLANSKGEEIDYEAIFKVEEKFKECLADYFIGEEGKECNPLIVLSPMPGGALTANTQMMRDNNCMHLYNDVIKAMREVVEKGGFGTSVTPVSQFYFQQAFANVTQGAWKKITDGYGKMVLGYFGQTPSAPDPEIVKLASQQLGLEPTTKDVHDINDANPNLGIAAATKKLQANGLPVNDENIFIVASCEDKGISFLKGESKLMTRSVADENRSRAEAILKSDKGFAEKMIAALGASKSAPVADTGVYTVSVDGRAYVCQVTPGGVVQSIQPVAAPAAPAPVAAAPAPTGQGTPVKSPMPGTVIKVLVHEGDAVKEGDDMVVIEAMKMEQPIKATKSGTVISIDVAEGDTLSADQTVAEIG